MRLPQYDWKLIEYPLLQPEVVWMTGTSDECLYDVLNECLNYIRDEHDKIVSKVQWARNLSHCFISTVDASLFVLTFSSREDQRKYFQRN